MLSARHLSAHSCLVASDKNENRFCEVARSIVENIRRIGRLLGIVYSTIAKNGLRRPGTINGNWTMKDSGSSTIPTFGPILCTGFRHAATLVTIGFQPSRIKQASCAGMTDGTGTTAGKETILSTQLFSFKFQNGEKNSPASTNSTGTCGLGRGKVWRSGSVSDVE